jgi:hypothetical protein
MCARAFRLLGLPFGVSGRFETRSRPALTRRYPRDFTFYLGYPFPRLFVCRYIARMERTLLALFNSCVFCDSLLDCEFPHVVRDPHAFHHGFYSFAQEAEIRRPILVVSGCLQCS